MPMRARVSAVVMAVALIGMVVPAVSAKSTPAALPPDSTNYYVVYADPTCTGTLAVVSHWTWSGMTMTSSITFTRNSDGATVSQGADIEAAFVAASLSADCPDLAL